MKNKIFMTFGGAIAALCPWVTHAETFPTDGNMLENKTYESAATYDNLGTYAGSVSAVAEYADILYQVGAGRYLPAGGVGTGVVCPSGNYCPGLTDATYNATDNQGLNACPDGYPMSESGASVDTQCYTPCTDTSVIAHATAVAGNDYYGNGTDTCYATACDNGYHANGMVEIIERDPLVNIDVTTVTDYSAGYISADGSYTSRQSEFGLTENNTWASSFYGGTVYGQASCQSVGTTEYQALNYFSGFLGREERTVEQVRTDLTEMVGAARANAVADVYAEYKAGTKTVDDVWRAADAIFAVVENADFSTTDSGKYCYCQMTDFKPTDGEKTPVTSAPWVLSSAGTADSCAPSCAAQCGRLFRGRDSSVNQYNYAFGAAVLGSLGAKTVGVCVANEISITWADADPADVAANNAGVCTYDGDIRTPAKAITKPGKTFKGWKFQKSN